jgi:UDP-N-acetylglucosamine pyrophosphorylase
MFLSNIDNLGATVDLCKTHFSVFLLKRNCFICIDILKHLLTDQIKHEFVMEVTDKTRADVKVQPRKYFLRFCFSLIIYRVVL